MAKLNSHPSLMFILIDPLEIKAPLVVALLCNLVPNGRSRTAIGAQVCYKRYCLKITKSGNVAQLVGLFSNVY